MNWKIRNQGTKIKIRLILLLSFIFLILFIVLFENRAGTENYLSVLLLEASILWTIWNGLTAGLVFSLLAVLVYGGYFLLYANRFSFTTDIQPEQAVWMILMPLGVLVAGAAAEAVFFVEKFHKKYERQVESLLLTGQLGMIGDENMFKMNLRQECARSRRSLSPLIVAVLSVANLSGLQKTLGLDAETIVANKISEIISQNTRDIDKKSRLDGARHGLILVDSIKDHAQVVIDRIRKKLGTADIEYRGRWVRVDIQVYMGLAVFPQDAITPEELTERAIKNLQAEFQQNKGGMGEAKSLLSDSKV